MDVKLTWFHNISRSLTDKLDSLWKLAETHQPTENEIKQFADQIASSWTSINHQVIFIYTLKIYFFDFLNFTFYLFNFNFILL